MNIHDITNELENLLQKGNVSTNETILDQHSKDESHHPPSLPQWVVFPESSDEVSAVMKLASTYEISVVPFGVGSSLEGHVIPVNGGISIDFSKMNKIIDVSPQDFIVRVQPGVTRTQLNKELKKYGLFFPVDPGADATIGGMTATNASGTTSVRYGIMRDQVRDIEVVLADGRIIRTGGLARKSSSGYHLNGLFVGSEGTLGCFTEITLQVYGIPEHTMAARAVFPDVKNAVNAVTSILSAGIPVARCELIDARSIKQVNLYKETDYPESPTLFLEFHGSKAALEHDIEFAKELLSDEECSDLTFETNSLAVQQLWEARHHLAYAFIHMMPGKEKMSTDVCLPISELAGALKGAREAIDASDLDGAVFGHVGDGNFHTLLMIDLNNPEEIKQAEAINEKIVTYALERGGTCTGEHGVGIGKRKYQRIEHKDALDVMVSLKHRLDPMGILNPGKIFE